MVVLCGALSSEEQAERRKTTIRYAVYSRLTRGFYMARRTDQMDSRKQGGGQNIMASQCLYQMYIRKCHIYDRWQMYGDGGEGGRVKGACGVWSHQSNGVTHWKKEMVIIWERIESVIVFVEEVNGPPVSPSAPALLLHTLPFLMFVSLPVCDRCHNSHFPSTQTCSSSLWTP